MSKGPRSTLAVVLFDMTVLGLKSPLKKRVQPTIRSLGFITPNRLPRDQGVTGSAAYFSVSLCIAMAADRLQQTCSVGEVASLGTGP